MRRFMIPCLITVALSSAAAFAQTPFTYQGQLKQNGQPFTGNANMVFSIYDAATGDGNIGDETHNNVAVTNGLFTVDLGGANYWDNQWGGDIWVEVSVNGTTLTPRQKISAAPRAITAQNLVLPFDSTSNNYSPSPLVRLYNQGQGGALTGVTNHPNANGITGQNEATNNSASGVLGVNYSPTGNGVGGLNLATTGNAPGGYFSSNSSAGFGVWGRAMNTAGNGSYGGFFENFGNGAFTCGLAGVAYGSNNAFGIRGAHVSASGIGYGVYGVTNSAQGYGGYFENSAGGIGLRVVGKTQTNVLQVLGGSDLSEGFDVGGDEIEPGTVVSIDPANPGKLIAATCAYDKKVAGIVSGAGGVNVGMIMGQEGSIANGSHPVALSGRVYCKANGGANGIEPGDLLTSSDETGRAMKAVDHDSAQGAIIGKAMTALKPGESGLVLVLVNLQ